MTDGPANPFRDDPFAPPQTVGRSVRAVPLLNLVALIVQLGGLAMMGRDAFAATVGAGSRGELNQLLLEGLAFLALIAAIVVTALFAVLVAFLSVMLIGSLIVEVFLPSIRSLADRQSAVR